MSFSMTAPTNRYTSIREAGRTAWALVGLSAVVVIGGYVLWLIRDALPIVLFAGVIVFLLNPVVSWFERRGIPRAIGTLFGYLGFFAILGLVGLMLTPIIRDQVNALSDQWPEVEEKINNWVDDLAEKSKDTPFEFTRQELEDEFNQPSGQKLSERFDRAIDLGTRIAHVLLILFLGPVVAFYVLADLPHVRKSARDLVPDRWRTHVSFLAHELNGAIGGFFRGQLLVASIVGVMCSIGLAIIGLPFWLIIGLIAGLFNMIPLVGPWIGGIPGVVIALTTKDLKTALLVVAVMAGAQQIDNHFITPTVMHRTVKLHPAVVVLSLVAGGSVGGFAGLFLAVPITACLKILLSYLWRVHVMGQTVVRPVEEVGVGGLVRDVVNVKSDLRDTLSAARRKGGDGSGDGQEDGSTIADGDAAAPSAARE